MISFLNNFRNNEERGNYAFRKSLYIHYILIEVSQQSLRGALLGNDGIFIVARSISLPSFLPFALPISPLQYNYAPVTRAWPCSNSKTPFPSCLLHHMNSKIPFP